MRRLGAVVLDDSARAARLQAMTLAVQFDAARFGWRGGRFARPLTGLALELVEAQTAGVADL